MLSRLNDESFVVAFNVSIVGAPFDWNIDCHGSDQYRLRVSVFHFCFVVHLSVGKKSMGVYATNRKTKFTARFVRSSPSFLLFNSVCCYRRNGLKQLSESVYVYV